MATRRRASRAAPPSINTNEPEQGRQQIPPKPKKPTVAQNALAIETLSQKITGVDAQLSTMNSLLAQLAAGQTSNNNNTDPIANTLTQSTSQTQPTEYQHVSHPVTHHGAAQQHAFGLAGHGNAGQTPAPTALQATHGQHSTMAGYAAGGPGLPRSRHHTTPACPYPPAPSWPTTAPSMSTGTTPLTGAHHHTLTNLSQPPPSNPWDHPTTLQDMETDPMLTRRVVEALSAAATPFTGINGRHAQFPHHLVTRGPKKSKTNLGELSMSEYCWGFMQIIKSKDFSDESIPFMNAHLESVLEDAMMYEWSDVRKWSEEICTRVAKNSLRWADTYIIDRLQTQLSHKNLLGTGNSTGGATAGRSDHYEMAVSVRQAKPGPPCKFFQSGICTHTGDHVQKGYRQLHVCAYCIANKCLLQPHSQKDCKTKKFNSQKKSQSDAGFGS